MRIELPPNALVVLVGVSGSGKSTFAAAHFDADDVLSSDAFRGLVSGDARDQTVTDEAFRRLHAALDQRLAAGRLTVVDATNVQAWARAELLHIATRHGRPAAAIVLAVPLAVSLERAATRLDRQVPEAVLRRQHRNLQLSLDQLGAEGFESIVILDGVRALEAAQVVKESDRRA